MLLVGGSRPGLGPIKAWAPPAWVFTLRPQAWCGPSFKRMLTRARDVSICPKVKSTGRQALPQSQQHRAAGAETGPPTSQPCRPSPDASPSPLPSPCPLPPPPPTVLLSTDPAM